jgi:hypothetical protein
VHLQSNTVVVDLSEEARAAGEVRRDRMRQQLVATLDVPRVELTVGGDELAAPASPESAAVIDPAVNDPVLIGTRGQFGFDSGDGISPIAGLTGTVVSLHPKSVTLAENKTTAAVLAGDGRVDAVVQGEKPIVLDRRPALTAPSIDSFSYVWSAQSASARSISAFALDGTQHSIKTGLPRDAGIISMSVSRDGARLLLYLSTSRGPRLAVAGIIRDRTNAPARLGDLLTLAAPKGKAIDAAWVNDRTVAALSRPAGVTQVTLFEIGGASVDVGQVPDATSIVGGNGGSTGIRVLRPSGEVWRPQGGGGWVNTGIVASYLATKQ